MWVINETRYDACIYFVQAILYCDILIISKFVLSTMVVDHSHHHFESTPWFYFLGMFMLKERERHTHTHKNKMLET